LKRIAAVAVLAALAASAQAAESPRWGSFELAAGTYRPDIDSEFDTAPGPFETVFGTGRGWMFRAAVAKSFLLRAGSLEVGLGSGYYQETGHGQLTDGTGASGDETKFRIIPATLMVTYRADFLHERYGVPLAPYGRLALERYYWWVTDGNSDTAEEGATNGWSVAGGLALLLDFFDSGLARDQDRETGINNTYLFFEVTKRVVDDFGSSDSWNLSDEGVGLTGGLLFVF
jgi:hypothetical protein